MKPIETKYNGYRFRSRLEARWAVFFDKMGIKYEYEPEGFVLTDGTHYLPDFRVTTPQGRTIWYEIKPSEDSDGIDKAEKFKNEFSAFQSTQSYILVGDPLEVISHKDKGVCPRCGLVGWVNYSVIDFGDQIGFGCQPCDLETPGGGDNPIQISPWAESRPHKGLLLLDQLVYVKHKVAVKNAATAARQARFEHGETPK